MIEKKNYTRSSTYKLILAYVTEVLFVCVGHSLGLIILDVKKSYKEIYILIRPVFKRSLLLLIRNGNLTLCFPLSFLCDFTKIDDDLLLSNMDGRPETVQNVTCGTSANHAHTRIVCSSDANDILIQQKKNSTFPYEFAFSAYSRRIRNPLWMRTTIWIAVIAGVITMIADR